MKRTDRTLPPSASKVAAVDFDGTIRAWGMPMYGFEAPFPGAPEAIRKLKDAGYTVYIFTSRLSPFWLKSEGYPDGELQRQVAFLQAYCEHWDIPADFVTAEKIPAAVYLDDKAMRVSPQRNLLKTVEAFLG